MGKVINVGMVASELEQSHMTRSGVLIQVLFCTVKYAPMLLCRHPHRAEALSDAFV